MPTVDELLGESAAPAQGAPATLPTVDQLLQAGAPAPGSAAPGVTFDDPNDPRSRLSQLGAAAQTSKPTPPESNWAWAKRQLLGNTDALIRGGLDLVGLPGTLDTAAGKYALGNPGYQSLLPTSQSLNEGLTRGEANSPHPVLPSDIAPQNFNDRSALALSRGLGAAPYMVALGMPPSIALASGVGGAEGASVGKDLAGTPGELVGGVVGGGLGQGLATTLGRRSLEGIAGKLGPSSDLQSAGRNLQERVSDWAQNTHPEWQHQVWADVDAKIPPTTATPLPQFTQALKDLTARTGSLQPVSDVLQGNMVKTLSNAMKGSQTVGRFNADPPTWGDVAQLRSQLGEMISNPALKKDLSDKQISALYSALTNDMRSTAHLQGAGEDFDLANTNSQALFKLATDKKGPVARVISDPDLAKNNIKPEDAARAVLSGAKNGSTHLDQLRMIAPEGVDDLAAAGLRQPSSVFHQLPQASQEALIASPLLRTQAIKASRAAAGESKTSVLHSPLQALVGENLGESLGTFAGHAANFAENSFLPPEAGKLVGLAAPYAYKALKSGAASPEKLQGAGLGLGLAAGDATAGTPPRQKN